MGNKNRSLLSVITSTKLALFLFFSIGFFLIPQTFFKTEILFHAEIKLLLLSILWINLAGCTVYRLKFSSPAALLFHVGCLITITGCLAGKLGYVATVNVYEGEKTYTAFRWDQNSELPLEFGLQIERINRTYYPTPVKIGVLEEGERKELFQLKTGESFSYGNYNVKVSALDVKNRSASLDISTGNNFLFSYDTAKEAEDNPVNLDFVLVAFQDQVLQRIWVDLQIEAGSEIVKGIAEVNNPFIWKSIRFFNTANGSDPLGKPYAGIQIVKDPGIPIVYLGFLIIAAGCLLRLKSVVQERPRNIA